MSEPFLGEIRMVGFNFAPTGWAFCAGQTVAIAQNSALFALLSTTFGGDGRVTFGLPDYRGRSPVGMGAGPGLTVVQQGEKSGTESVVLTSAQMPQHTHAAVFTGQAGPVSGTATTTVSVTRRVRRCRQSVFSSHWASLASAMPSSNSGRNCARPNWTWIE